MTYSAKYDLQFVATKAIQESVGRNQNIDLSNAVCMWERENIDTMHAILSARADRPPAVVGGGKRLEYHGIAPSGSHWYVQLSI